MSDYVTANLKLDASSSVKALANAIRERDERIRKLEGLLQEYIYHACSSCGHPGLRDDIADRARKLLGEG